MGYFNAFQKTPNWVETFCQPEEWSIFHFSLSLVYFSLSIFDRETVLGKCSLGLLSKLQLSLPRPALMTIYKVFVRPHLDYGDILFDQTLKHIISSKTRKNTK